jgi:hypothetical protein
MSKGRKTGGRNFKPGNKANPHGRPQVPPEVKEARKLNQSQMELIFNKLIHMTEVELKAHWTNPQTPKFEKIVCKILNEAEIRGDHYRLDFVLNRLIGKVTEKVLHELPKPFVVKKSDGSQIVMGARLPKKDTENEEDK